MPDKLLMFRRENGALVTILTADPLPIAIDPAEYGVERGEMISLVIGLHLGNAISGVPLPVAGQAPGIAGVHVSAVRGGAAIASAKRGDTVWAVATGVTGEPQPSLSYQWRLNGTEILGATGESHAVAASGALSVTVRASNGVGTSAAATSDAVTVPVGVPAWFAAFHAVYEVHPAYLAQNPDGTGAVTADGDPVGRLADRKGVHPLFAAGTDRPVYRTNGILHWLEFTNPRNLVSGAISPGATPLTLAIAWERLPGGAAGNQNNAAIISVPRFAEANWRSISMPSETSFRAIRRDEATGLGIAGPQVDLAGLDRRVVLASFPTLGTSGNVEIATDAGAPSDGVLAMPAAAPDRICIGRLRDTTNRTPGRFFGGAIAFASPAAADLAAARTWLNERAGL